MEPTHAGLIFALVPAIVLVRDRALDRRRRRALNRSLHELRRPLQALALAGEGPQDGGPPGFLELALAALADLDRAVNGGGGTQHRMELSSSRDLIVAAVARWRSRSPSLGLKLYWDAGEAIVLADRDRIAQALDNMIANALEHGRPPLALTASLVSGRVRITLADAGVRAAASPNRNANGGGPDPRRGHGLALVSDVAAAHGGRFALSRSRRGSVAALELPLAGPRAAAAA